MREPSKIDIDAMACTSKTIGVKQTVSAARLLGSKHSKLRQKKPYKATSCKCHHFQIAIITCKFLNEIHLKPDETYEEIGLEAGVEIERKTSNWQFF